MNDQLIEALSGPHLQIGPSYFMKKRLDRDAVRRIWEYNIEPFIEDQFFGDPAQIEQFRFAAVLAAVGTVPAPEGRAVLAVELTDLQGRAGFFLRRSQDRRHRAGRRRSRGAPRSLADDLRQHVARRH